MKVVME